MRGGRTFGLPGTEGQGVADVLFGDDNPAGKLPMTWMQSAGQQPINDGDGKPALFPYGRGDSFPATQSPYNLTDRRACQNRNTVTHSAPTAR